MEQEHRLEELNINKPVNIGGLPGYENLTAAEQNVKLQEMFREVFGSENGKIVLGVILEDLYYFSSTNNEATAALSNYAKTLLAQRLGINNTKRIIDELFKTVE